MWWCHWPLTSGNNLPKIKTLVSTNWSNCGKLAKPWEKKSQKPCKWSKKCEAAHIRKEI
jgi:hypothetical protein